MSESTQKSRTYSKRMTALSLLGIYGMAAYGMFTRNPDTADIVTNVGSVTVGLLIIYMGVGHLDLRQFLASSAASLLDFKRKPNG